VALFSAISPATLQMNGPPVEITVFQACEWKLYRDIRLQALQDAPDSFSTLYKEAVRLSDEKWKSRLVTSHSDFLHIPIKAVYDGGVVGMAWGRINCISPETAYLYQMWVSPRFRCLGIGHRILEKFVSWSKSNGATRAQLGVTCSVEAAYGLYRKFGFRPVRELESLREDSTLLVQTMVLQLTNASI